MVCEMDVYERLEKWMEEMGLSENIPSAYSLWKKSNYFLKNGDPKKSKIYERMNYLFHNSSIPATVDVGEKVNFAYGGIGLIIHANSIIGNYATIGSNVTLGGRGGSKVNYTVEGGKKMWVPRIGDYSYIATGSKILGGVDVGACSIVGANSVVLDHVPPCTIVAGTPAKIIAYIDSDNMSKYKNNFTQFRNLTDEEVLKLLDHYSNS